jgi:hypothetical protein
VCHRRSRVNPVSMPIEPTFRTWTDPCHHGAPTILCRLVRRCIATCVVPGKSWSVVDGCCPQVVTIVTDNFNLDLATRRDLLPLMFVTAGEHGYRASRIGITLERLWTLRRTSGVHPGFRCRLTCAGNETNMCTVLHAYTDVDDHEAKYGIYWQCMVT